MRILGTVASSSREVPNAPTIGTATNVGSGRAYNNGRADVTFTAPTFDGGLPITSYTVTSSPGGFTASGASSPLTVTGLASSTSYTFTVTATNARGTGPASAASNSITATTVPQAPTIGTATDAGTGTSVTVAYTAGATGGAAVSTYTATSSPGSLTGTGASPITVSGLTSGTAYTFTVTATNANGTSSASAASNSVTPATPLGQASWESISTTTLTGTASSITFSSIPSTYKYLQLRGIARDDKTSNYNNDDLYIVFNGDTGANYSQRIIYAGFGGVSQNSVSGLSQVRSRGGVQSGLQNTYSFGANIIDIYNYADTGKLTTVKMNSGARSQRTSAEQYYSMGQSIWSSTAVVSTITLSSSTGSFVAGTSFALYGIKG